jgi:hypothetical protein
VQQAKSDDSDKPRWVAEPSIGAASPSRTWRSMAFQIRNSGVAALVPGVVPHDYMALSSIVSILIDWLVHGWIVQVKLDAPGPHWPRPVNPEVSGPADKCTIAL